MTMTPDLSKRGPRAGLLALLVLGCSIPLQAQQGKQERSLELLRQRYEQRHAAFAGEMRILADFCESQSFLTDAEQIRRKGRPVEQRAVDLDDLPQEVLPPLPANLSDAERQWRTKLRKLQKDYALDLYRLARQALHGKHASVAFQLVREVVFHDPDHKHARQLLGFVRYGDEWTTPFARTMKTRGFVDHPEFGWIPKRYVSRYENGERHFNGNWMGLAREASLRAEFQNGWEVESEHFLVKTNHSLEKGVEIARALEAFHRFFIREYARFFNSPQQMQKLFDEGAAGTGRSANRHRVYYYRNKDEFVAALKTRQPNAEMINGLYLPAERTAYFYHDDQTEGPSETMFHEVTHQLLSESSSRPVDVGEADDFWVVEGFACYIESYRHDEHGIRIGEVPHPRIFWARHLAVEQDLYVPMREFMMLGMREFQSPPTGELLHAYYSQAAGMCHFFLHYEQGRYRDAFIEYLSHVYSPVSRVRSSANLAQSTGVRFETLDEQYLEYLRALPSEPPLEIEVIREER